MNVVYVGVGTLLLLWILCNLRRRRKNRNSVISVVENNCTGCERCVKRCSRRVLEQVAAWLYRVVRNTIINHGVKKREEAMPACQNDENDDEMLKDFSEALFGNETSPSPDTEYLRSLVWQELEAALSELPPEQRDAFDLMELDGLPAKEVAKITGVSVNTLLSRKHYAVMHLRERLKALYDDILCY